MKKIFVSLTCLIAVVITGFNFNINLKNSGNNSINLYSLASIEALASERTRCLVASGGAENNTGYCKPAVNPEKGAVCVAPGLMEYPNCYDHEIY